MKHNVVVLLGLMLITLGAPPNEAREARLPSEANAPNRAESQTCLPRWQRAISRPG